MVKIICDCRNECTLIAVISSIIIGVIAGILRFTAVITTTPAFLWVTFGIAVLYLALLLITSVYRDDRRTGGCVCNTLPVVLTGILGTVLTSVILLGVTFAATSVLGAIITGALLFFFSLIITSAACLVRCSSDCEDRCTQGSIE